MRMHRLTVWCIHTYMCWCIVWCIHTYMCWCIVWCICTYMCWCIVWCIRTYMCWCIVWGIHTYVRTCVDVWCFCCSCVMLCVDDEEKRKWRIVMKRGRCVSDSSFTSWIPFRSGSTAREDASPSNWASSYSLSFWSLPRCVWCVWCVGVSGWVYEFNLVCVYIYIYIYIHVCTVYSVV